MKNTLVNTMKKKTKPSITKGDLMERTRASVCYLNDRHGAQGETEKMYAFLSLFHPEMSHVQKVELSRQR